MFRSVLLILVGAILGVLTVASAVPQAKASPQREVMHLDYQTVVTQEFIPRNLAALNGIKASLVSAGMPASAITVSMPDTEDLRWQITAKRGNREIIGYIELTAAFRSGGPRSDVLFTLWLEGNGVELTTSYTPGPTVHQTSDAGLEALLAKLAQLEATVPEAAVKIRAFLGL